MTAMMHFLAGIGLDYYLGFNVGFTYKHITSQQPGGILLVNQNIKMKATVDAVDYGVLIVTPLMKLLNDPMKFEYSSGLSISPFLNLSIGYAKRNSGGELTFDSRHSDPIFRVPSLGYTISAGAYIELQKDNRFKLFEADFSTEAEDLLVKFNFDALPPEDFFSYQSFLGDIDPWRNVILARWDGNVMRHRGIRLELAEVLELTWGSVKLYGSYIYHNNDTQGWGIRTNGILKALRPAGKTIAFIADHFELKYFHTVKNSSLFTDLSSFTFVVSGLEKLF